MAFFRCGSSGGGGTITVAPEISGSFGANTGIKILNGKYITGFDTGATNRMYYPLTKTGAAPSYDFSKPFVLKIKLQITGTFTGGQLLCGPLGIYTRTDNAANAFVLEWNAGTTTYLRITATDLPVALNTWYTLTVNYTAGSVAFTATDGITTKTITASVQQHAAMSGQGFGNYTQNTNLHLIFDFSETYWEQDGVMIWGNKPA